MHTGLTPKRSGACKRFPGGRWGLAFAVGCLMRPLCSEAGSAVRSCPFLVLHCWAVWDVLSSAVGVSMCVRHHPCTWHLYRTSSFGCPLQNNSWSAKTVRNCSSPSILPNLSDSGSDATSVLAMPSAAHATWIKRKNKLWCKPLGCPNLLLQHYLFLM